MAKIISFSGDAVSGINNGFIRRDPLRGIDRYTVLMLHMDGTNDSTTFIDSSPSSKAVAANGNVKISTAQSKFGGSSGYFDGTGGNLSLIDSTDWYFDTGDFTIDFFINISSFPSSISDIFGQYNAATYAPVRLLITNTGTLNLYGSSNGASWDIFNGNAGGSLSLNTWYHIAVVRNGTSVNVYINGVSVISRTTSASLPDMSNVFCIGSLNGSYGTNGYIDEFRVSKGIARWTRNFTPPIESYSA